MGDFNLSSKISQDVQKLEELCQTQKFIALKEITRVISNNQLDHILSDKQFLGKYFATSYYNFISDHKTITIRIGINTEFTINALEKINFHSELHMKEKIPEDEVFIVNDKTTTNVNIIDTYKRRFQNPDMSTSWLNSCLQLILAAFEHFLPEDEFKSPLGITLQSILSLNSNQPIDPTQI